MFREIGGLYHNYSLSAKVNVTSNISHLSIPVCGSGADLNLRLLDYSEECLFCDTTLCATIIQNDKVSFSSEVSFVFKGLCTAVE
jgi:hypothetical protein